MTGLAVIGSTADVLMRFADPQTLLTPAERTRAAGFRFDADRDDFVAAHLLVRICVAEVTGRSPHRLTLAQRCQRCDGPHGRPSIVETPDRVVSMSHTRGHVAASISHTAIGVDVERRDRPPPRGIGDVVLTPAEAAFVSTAPDEGRALLELWVRKEAVIKACGTDLGQLASIEVVRDGRIADAWKDLRLTGWPGDGQVIAACAATTAVNWRSL